MNHTSRPQDLLAEYGLNHVFQRLSKFLKHLFDFFLILLSFWEIGGGGGPEQGIQNRLRPATTNFNIHSTDIFTLVGPHADTAADGFMKDYTPMT